ncbi:MAG TPA: 3-hydroxyacyl-CoA dehydrogenase family protein [Puia sp.]|nr:3-hydroxyacyl-CoA dehydrogenase family protein [Puia sp.]
MTIVVITEAKTESDIPASFPAPGNKWILVRTAGEAEAHPGADAYIDLEFINEPGRVDILRRLLPAVVLVNAVVSTLGEIGSPFVRINGWPGFLERTIHELVVSNELSADRFEELKDRLTGLYERLGREYRLVPDIPGMISGRILATIINEAYYTWEEEVSTREEIDIAMKLGTNYPLGPFEWGRRIGLEKVADLLAVLSRNNSRYTPSNSLLKAVNVLKYD